MHRQTDNACPGAPARAQRARGRFSKDAWAGTSGSTVSMESLILAQDERWRRASYMQVERGPFGGNTGEGRVANGCVTREQPAPETGITPGNRC
jgi:hypothetical protein